MDTMILAQAQGGNALSALFPFLILFVLFYVMIILPQRRQQKEHQRMVAALQKGDRIATAGGLIGEIAGLKDEEILLKTGQSTVVVAASGHPLARRQQVRLGDLRDHDWVRKALMPSGRTRQAAESRTPKRRCARPSGSPSHESSGV